MNIVPIQPLEGVCSVCDKPALLMDRDRVSGLEVGCCCYKELRLVDREFSLMELEEDYPEHTISYETNPLRSLVLQATLEWTPERLALGFLRYEAVQRLTPGEFKTLYERDQAGERLDDMVNELVIQHNK